MSANEPPRGAQRRRVSEWLYGFGQSRAPGRLLAELLPVLLAKAVAAALLWWVIFGTHR
ncbi:MAG TPA: hypothetical protein VFW82_11870 [Dyella sp.]|nr:hypothetical protein [Dyella sp.]